MPASVKFLSLTFIDRLNVTIYANIMRMTDIITKKLTEAFAPESIQVVDESHQHVGHAGHRPGGESHFRIHIVSEAFDGKSRIDRHRMINAILSAELADRIHALAIHAAAPRDHIRSN